MEYELLWHDCLASPELEAIVVEDLRKHIDCPAEKLLGHIVFLGDMEDDNAPVIKVWGEPNDHRFHCRMGPSSAYVMKIHLDDIPEFKEKLIAAGWKDPDESDA